ncbi:MAG: nascent polypeptide-associated complex protein [Nitrososphaerales archaeon]
MFRGRDMRRMLERMGVNLEPIPNVEEVIIKTSDKEIIIKNANVSEVKTKDFRFFQVVGGDVEEKIREKPKFSEEDILLVAQQAGVSREKALAALEEANGEPAKAILKLIS